MATPPEVERLRQKAKAVAWAPDQAPIPEARGRLCEKYTFIIFLIIYYDNLHNYMVNQLFSEILVNYCLTTFKLVILL